MPNLELGARIYKGGMFGLATEVNVAHTYALTKPLSQSNRRPTASAVICHGP